MPSTGWTAQQNANTLLHDYRKVFHLNQSPSEERFGGGELQFSTLCFLLRDFPVPDKFVSKIQIIPNELPRRLQAKKGMGNRIHFQYRPHHSSNGKVDNL